MAKERRAKFRRKSDRRRAERRKIERRKYQRIVKPFLVSLRIMPVGEKEKAQSDWNMERVDTLGPDGMSFKSHHKYDVGTVLELKLRLPFSNAPIKCTGRVIRVETSPPGTLFHTAVVFVKLVSHGKEGIKELTEDSKGGSKMREGNLDCPKCVGKLQKKKLEKIEVDACFICEGIWFDAGELKDVIEADSKDFDFIDVGKEEYDGKEIAASGVDLNAKKGKCPRCSDGTMLVQTQYEKKKKVRVDICPKGHGIWLDGGEILQLRKRGLVKLKDRLAFEKDFLRYAFSKQGFGDLMSRFSRKK